MLFAVQYQQQQQQHGQEQCEKTNRNVKFSEK
jgi:hypothetical protein